jgi:RHS repeat-associated protein
VFYYDSKRRVIQSVASNHLGGYEKEYFNYSFTGNVLWNRKIHSASGKDNITETYAYTYDHANRLTVTKYRLDNNDWMTLSALVYDNLGRLKEKKLLSTDNPTTYKQNIAYQYNIRNRMNEISSTMFSETLSYSGLYNGNISSMEWKSPLCTQGQGYRFYYDNLNRLILSAHYFSAYANNYVDYSEFAGYDKMGNITALKRCGAKSSFAAAGNTANSSYIIDDLTLLYEGNRLQQVEESATIAAGFIKPDLTASVEYDYNKNGAMTMDLNSGVSKISYNVLNLPNRIDFGETHSTKYMYDANGVKRRVEHITYRNNTFTLATGAITTGSVATGSIGTSTSSSSGTSTYGSVTTGSASSYYIVGDITTTDYCGNIVYENGTLKYILNTEGYVTKSGNAYTYHYYLKDHLGNNRVVMCSDGVVAQATDYYPFGAPHGNALNPERQPYKFGGKELDEMHGLNQYDFQARRMSRDIPRFTTMDPLAEKYYNISPYAYCKNNPVRFIDPDGRDVKPIDEEALKMIQNTLTKEDMQYVRMDKNGLIDKEYLNSHKSESGNYNSLSELVNSDIVTNVAIVEGNISYMDNEGNMQTMGMPYGEVIPEFADPHGLTSDGVSTGETGRQGITLLPGQGKSGVNSPNGEIHVYVNGQFSEAAKAEIYSHEANGHARTYVQTKSRTVAAHDFRNGAKDYNTQLVNTIKTTKQETIKNMRSR